MKKFVLLAFVLALVAITFFSFQNFYRGTKHDCCAKENHPIVAESSDKTATEVSIYNLPGTWKDQDNHLISFQSLSGKVQVVAMIFTHCGYACPRIVDNMKDIASKLTVNQKDKVGFVLITFDPDRDTPSQLKTYAVSKQLDNHWTLLQGSKDQIRELSLLLDLQYNQQVDGNFSHSNAITILDKNGTIVKRLEGLAIDPTQVAATITTLMN